MSDMIWSFVILPIILIALFFYVRLWNRYNLLRNKFRSISVKYGQVVEQFLPISKEYPYDRKQFHFLGNPVDGVQFNNDEIVFIEFKSGKSRLSHSQQKIKNLISKKKVRFEEMRMS